MSDTRLVLDAPASATLEVRKSRFLANAARVESEPAALEFLQRVADPSATHNCWAWRVGQLYRFNDDGEPGGTAGKPILQAIDGQSLDCVMLVVTRWFGGIKLGTGGLIRAYGGCAAECLRQAAKSEQIETVRMEIDIDFSILPMLRARLPALSARVEAENFHAQGTTLIVNLPVARLSELNALLANLTRGQVAAQPMESE